MADNDGDSDEARTLRPLQAAACTYRIAFGPRAGQKVLTLQGAIPRETDFKQTLALTVKGSACTPPCAARPTTAKRWSDCAATSHARRWPTNPYKPMPLAAEAEDPLARRQHPPDDVAPGVHAAEGWVAALRKPDS
jgi:hypothetical protein